MSKAYMTAWSFLLVASFAIALAPAFASHDNGNGNSQDNKGGNSSTSNATNTNANTNGNTNTNVNTVGGGAGGQGGNGFGFGVGIGKGGNADADASVKNSGNSLNVNDNDTNVSSRNKNEQSQSQSSKSKSEADADANSTSKLYYTNINPQAPVNTAVAPSASGDCRSMLGFGFQGDDAGASIGIPISSNWCRIQNQANWLLLNVGRQAAIKFLCVEVDAIEDVLEDICKLPVTLDAGRGSAVETTTSRNDVTPRDRHYVAMEPVRD